jgi:hypothetical protein
LQRVWKFIEAERRLESVGILGQQSSNELSLNTEVNGTSADAMDTSNDDDAAAAKTENETETEPYKIKGVVNDIAIISRGKPKTGDNELFSVVCAVGKEHRLGRFGSGIKGAKNGAVVFELQKKKDKAKKTES